MDIHATHKNARMSPRKMRPLARILQGVPVKEAKVQLEYFPGKAAVIIHDVLQSAVANAKHNFFLDESNLIVRNVLISPGFVMKRFMPVAKGTAHAILKRTAHVTVIVGEAVADEKKVIKAKSTEIETLSAQEYAERGGQEEETLAETTGDETKPIAGKGKTDKRNVSTVLDKKSQEAFSRTKMMQQGSDTKITHRGQGKKTAAGDK